MESLDSVTERYPTYLRRDFFSAMAFFELPVANGGELVTEEIVNLHRDLMRFFYGGCILSCKTQGDDATATFGVFECETAMEQFGSLTESIYSSATLPGPPHLGMECSWSDIRFADFAFDILALLNGTFRRGSVSSFHGLDMRKLKAGPPP